MKKYLVMAVLPFLFLGCSSKTDAEKVDRPEILKVDSKHFSKFGEPDFENTNAKSKLKKYKLTEKW